jgi:hypothetical protein
MSVPDREVDVNRIFRALTVGVCDLQAKLPCPVGAPPKMKMDDTAKGTEPDYRGRSYC